MKISYCLPLHNEGSAKQGIQTLDKNINSILGILKPDDELLVYNDASTDDTSEAFKKIRDLNNVFVFECETRKGPGYARNFLADKANNEIIAHCDADNYLQNRGSIIREHFKDVDIMGTWLNKIDYENNIRCIVKTEKVVYTATSIEKKETMTDFPFSEQYLWHDLFFEKHYRMKAAGKRFKIVPIVTMNWELVRGNYERHKSEIGAIKQRIKAEYEN